MAQLAYGSITITDTNDIESIIIEYAKNQSTFNPPDSQTGGWSTARPAWQQGYYIWQRTRIHKSGTEESADVFGTAVCLTGSTGQQGIQGIQGPQGETGAAGRSLDSTETKYAQVAENSTETQVKALAETRWTTNVPAYSSSLPEYWVRVVNTYSNPTETESIYYKDQGLTDAVAKANDAWNKADNAQKDVEDLSEQVESISQETALLGGHFIYNSEWQTTNTPHSANVVENIGADEAYIRTPSQWHYNVHIGANGIKLRYNELNLSSWTGTALTFYKPSLTSQGNKTMELSTTGLTFYDGSAANGGNIQAQFGSSGAIQSGDYAINAATDKFSTYGTKIDLTHGEIYSPYFRLSQGSVSGGPVAGIYMSGTFESTGAIIGHQKTSNSDTNAYWKIGYMTDTNQDRLTYQRADSNGFIELAPSATFILQKNKIHTGWFGNNGYLTYPQLNSKYYDFGMNLPTSLSDKFLYIRYNSGSNLSTIYQNDSGWTYPFYVDAEGKVHAQNFYIGDSTTPIGGGSGTIAEKLMSGAGSATQPVYFRSDSGHVGEVATTTYALNAAGAKGVDTSMPTTATDNNVPTTKLMKTFVEGKGYITGYTETDPTVPSWAKASSKPSYALSEITSADDIKAIEALTGTSGFLKKTAANAWTLDTNTYLTSYTESDPTVPSWAKQSSKPSYGLTEISGTTDLQAIEALTGTSGFLKKTNSNTWTLDTSTYLTSYTETDPVFSASAAANITSSDITNWNGKTSNVGTVISVKVQGSNGLTGNGTVTTSGTITISHADTSSQASSSNSGRTYIQSVTLDDYGHVTGLSTATETVTDTHHTAYLYNGSAASGTSATANKTVSSGYVYLNLVENGSVRSSHKLITANGLSITSTSDGDITFTSPDAFTAVTTVTVNNKNYLRFTKSGGGTADVSTENIAVVQAQGATKLVGADTNATPLSVTGPVKFSNGVPVQMTAANGDSISWGLITGAPSTYTPSSHTHGNLSNDGKITSTATIANGDKLVIVDTDSTAGSKITGSSITFGTSTSTFLSNKGTWETPIGTTYTFDGTYNASSNKAATVSTVTNAINALDVSAQTGAQSKTITSISETDGKISVTYSNISITKSQISDFPTSMAPTAHNHSQIVTVGDQRSTATTPNSYSNALIFQGLKSKATVGSPSDDTYSYLVGLRGWSDSSGGNSHELAFNNTGIFWRQGATTSWGNWYRIYTTGNKPTASDVGLGNVTNYDSSVAIKSITRSGTTFTYTTVAGNTGTFTQQDNNTWDALSTSQAGYVAKAPNDTGKFLRGDATWAAVTKSNVGLGNVENTALSTWTGTNKITTLGTITTGTWNGSAIPVANGGTGATTATNARSNLGLGSAATASTTTSIASGGTGLPTAGTVYTYVSNQVGNYVAKSGDTMTGTLTTPELITTKLTAEDVNVTHLLTAEGIQTKNWTATNMSTIDGSFYICPTISCQTGTITYNSGGTLQMVTGTVNNTRLQFDINSLFISKNEAVATWTQNSLVMITGEVLIGQEYCSIGTIRGKITATSGNPSTTSIVIGNLTTNITTNTSPKIISLMTAGTAYTFRDLKISLYSYYNSSSSQENLLGIMMTTAGAGNRTYIDIYNGANQTNGKTSTGGFTYTEPVVRVGNLNGLNSYVQSGKFTVTPKGWGIYTTNGFFVGDVYAENGYIGGFTIGATALYNGSTGINNTTSGVYLGYTQSGSTVSAAGLNVSGGTAATTITFSSSNFTKTINGTSRSTLRVAIGSNFGMDSSGNIYANGANITNINANNISTNMLSAMQAVVSNLSVLRADMGSITAGSISRGNNSINFNQDLATLEFKNASTWASATQGIKYDSNGLAVKGAITATSLTINNTNYLSSITSIPTISTTADNASYSVEIEVKDINYTTGKLNLVAHIYKLGTEQTTTTQLTGITYAWKTIKNGTVSSLSYTTKEISITSGADLEATYICTISKT